MLQGHGGVALWEWSTGVVIVVCFYIGGVCIVHLATELRLDEVEKCANETPLLIPCAYLLG